MGLLNIFKKKKEEKLPKDQDKVITDKKQKKEREAKIKPAPISEEPKTAVKTDIVKSEDKKVLLKKDKPKIAKRESGDLAKYSRILIKPLVTERSADLGTLNKYVFEVARSANKVEIKKAIKSVYGVEPLSVNIINIAGRAVRYGKTFGRTKSRCKAIVTLKEGDKIEIYHGV